METRRKQTPQQVAYLAGLIDADGYIGITKSKPLPGNTKNPQYSLTVNVTNTSREMMDWLEEHFDGTVYSRKMPDNKNWKQCYNFIATHQRGKRLLELVKDYLVIKKPQALLGLELMNNWVTDNRGTPLPEVARREEIYRRFLDLNAVGAVQRERLSSEAPSQKKDEAIV